MSEPLLNNRSDGFTFRFGTMLLFAVACAHFLISVILYTVACSDYLAGLHNGEGLWNFAYDSFEYHRIGIARAELIAQGKWSLWYYDTAQWHLRLIGLAYYLFGASLLSFALCNALTWAAVGFFIYQMARHGVKAPRNWALIAAASYLCWPSNLALSTQLLKEPYYALAHVLFLAGWAALIGRRASPSHMLWVGAGVWLAVSIRSDSYLLLMALSSLAVVMLLIWRRHNVLLAILALLLLFTPKLWAVGAEAETPNPLNITEFHTTQVIGVEREALVSEVCGKLKEACVPNELNLLINKYMDSDYPYNPPHNDQHELKVILLRLADTHGSGLVPFLKSYMRDWRNDDSVPDIIEAKMRSGNYYRDSFLTYYLHPDSAVVDADRVFRSAGEIFAYIPRALVVAFCAPFPRSWLSLGKTGGSAIRLIASIETCVLYGLYFLILLRLFTPQNEMLFIIWVGAYLLLFLIPLGLFIPNIGTLYRMRLAYYGPVIVLGVEGLRWTLVRWRGFSSTPRVG